MIFGKGNWQETEVDSGIAIPKPLHGLVGLLRAYAAILFVEHPVTGLLFLLATFFFPNVGLAGLLAALVGLGTAQLFRFPYLASGLYVYNSMLVGLSLGAFYQLDTSLALLIVLSSALAVFFAAGLLDMLWRLGHLPILSLPFVLMALIAALAAKSYGTLTPYVPTVMIRPDLFGGWLDTFFSALGATFFNPQPIVGLVLFFGILMRSRYLALLCFCGFMVGYGVFLVLTADPRLHMIPWSGFNFSLTAMALGGIFTVPSRASFALAMTAAALAALLTAALNNLFLFYNLPVMALPFLLATLPVLAALRMRIGLAPPILLLEQPSLPEVNYERARIARERIGELDSVPLLVPCFGEWEVYQGFRGRHTHRGSWQHALDFYMTVNGKSYQEQGTRLTDFYCFGKPVLSPARGTVVKAQADLPDNAPGEVDTRHNWGNYILIRLDSGLHVLMAHLAHDSLKVREGENVTPDTLLARCGNSGRSPQPHLHVQVQRDARLGSGTVPFHLSNLVVRMDQGKPEFKLAASPDEGTLLQRAEKDQRLAHLHLPVGRMLRYRVRCPGEASAEERELQIQLTLLGQFRIVSERGASAAFEEEQGVLAFYDRQGPRDPFLDLWLLNMSVLPFTGLAQHWRDKPPVRWLPLNPMQRLWLGIIRPLGCGFESRFQRTWDDCAETYSQSAEQSLELPGFHWQSHTKAVLSPEYGCSKFSLEAAGRCWSAELIEIGQVADRGVPAWGRAVPVSDTARGSQPDGAKGREVNASKNRV